LQHASIVLATTASIGLCPKGIPVLVCSDDELIIVEACAQHSPCSRHDIATIRGLLGRAPIPNSRVRLTKGLGPNGKSGVIRSEQHGVPTGTAALTGNKETAIGSDRQIDPPASFAICVRPSESSSLVEFDQVQANNTRNP